MASVIATKRVYEESARGDGARILVDRLWPRGVRKEDASWREWRKDLAPSPELRTWYGHDAARFEEFAHRYRAELASTASRTAIGQLLDAHATITLLTATKDLERSGAAVLAAVMRRRARSGREPAARRARARGRRPPRHER